VTKMKLSCDVFPTEILPLESVGRHFLFISGRNSVVTTEELI